MERYEPFNNLKNEVAKSVLHFSRYILAKKYAKGRVLDLCCGTGYGSYILSKVFKKPKDFFEYKKIKLDDNISKIISVDKSKPAISFARRNYRNSKINFICSDACDEKIFSKKYNTIVILEGIEHIKDYQKALENCYKSLAKKGKFIVSIPAYYFEEREKFSNIYHFHVWQKNEFKKILKKAGFKKIIMIPVDYYYSARLFYLLNKQNDFLFRMKMQPLIDKIFFLSNKFRSFLYVCEK